MGLPCSSSAGEGGFFSLRSLLAPYLRRFGGYTVPDFLGERFGAPGVRPLAVLAVILCSFPALALVLMGLGRHRHARLRRRRRDGHRGWRGDVARVQPCRRHALGKPDADRPIRRAARGLGRRAGASASGNRERCFRGIEPAGLKSALAMLQAGQLRRGGRVNRFALLFCLGAGMASLPHLLMRSLVTPSIEEARTSFLWALPFAAALCLVAAPYALAVRRNAGGFVRYERDPLFRA